ncbi:MAG: addiction module protein [Betaproteobacteria bacterium]|nr:addiction module protein [Betaproteobacteria bacterium]
MLTQTKVLLEQVKKLPEDEQIELADMIYAEASITKEEWDAVWAEECARRIAEFESGKVQAIDADTVFAELKQKYGWK